MEVIQWCAVIGAIVLCGCLSRLSNIASHLYMVSQCAQDIRLETEGLNGRLQHLEKSFEELQEQVQKIAGVAKDYDFEVLSPMARHRREIETDSEIFG